MLSAELQLFFSFIKKPDLFTLLRRKIVLLGKNLFFLSNLVVLQYSQDLEEQRLKNIAD
jgi:hypothetical protein